MAHIKNCEIVQHMENGNIYYFKEHGSESSKPMEICQIKKMVKVGLASFHFPHREMECHILPCSPCALVFVH